MISQNADASLGNVMVATSDDGGHKPEFWADVITTRLVSISASAEPHVRQQAEAFRQQVYEVVLRGIKAPFRAIGPLYRLLYGAKVITKWLIY